MREGSALSAVAVIVCDGWRKLNAVLCGQKLSVY